MCGIVYHFNKNKEPVGVRVIDTYIKQVNRGDEGFGIVHIAKDGIKQMYTTAQDLMLEHVIEHKDESHMLLHHRKPTSTKNTIEGCHPFIIKHKGRTFYFAHNGSIQNAQELFEDHYEDQPLESLVLEDGKEQFNDSEILALEFSRFMTGDIPAIRARGPIAFICFEQKEDGSIVLHYGRNADRPLKRAHDKNDFILSSEGPGEEIKEDMLYTYDFATNKTTKKKVELPKEKVVTKTWGSWQGGAQRSAPTMTQKKEVGFIDKTAQENVEEKHTSWEDWSECVEDGWGTIETELEKSNETIEEYKELARETKYEELRAQVEDEVLEVLGGVENPTLAVIDNVIDMVAMEIIEMREDLSETAAFELQPEALHATLWLLAQTEVKEEILEEYREELISTYALTK